MPVNQSTSVNDPVPYDYSMSFLATLLLRLAMMMRMALSVTTCVRMGDAVVLVGVCIVGTSNHYKGKCCDC